MAQGSPYPYPSPFMTLHQSAQAARTKYFSLGAFNNSHDFSQFWKLGSPTKIKVLAHSVPGESPVPRLQTTTFSLCLHVVGGGEGWF